MPMFDLIPHPDFPSIALDAIAVCVDRPVPDRLVLRYQVRGALSLVVWPAPADGAFADELWRHSCFEAFVALPDAGYVELNVSPSTRWAAYAFDGYRTGMRRAMEIAATDIVWSPPEGQLVAELSTTPDWLTGAPMALTAVIEAADGSRSFWALAHGDGPPDFHNADCFIATLPAPDRL